MRIIRSRCFETNSSSTHSLIVVTDKEMELLEHNELYVYDDRVVTKKERDDIIKNIAIMYNKTIEEIENENWNIPITLDNWMYNEYEYGLEIEEYSHVTNSGEKLNIICKFGQDG